MRHPKCETSTSLDTCPLSERDFNRNLPGIPPVMTIFLEKGSIQVVAILPKTILELPRQ